MEKSVYEIIQDWHELLKKGVISEDEFVAKKKELLENDRSAVITIEDKPVIVAEERNNNHYDYYQNVYEEESFFSKYLLFIILGTICLGIFGSFYYYQHKDKQVGFGANSAQDTIAKMNVSKQATIADETEEIDEPEIDVFEVPFREENGVKIIDAWVNGMGLEFIFDSGASSTMLSKTEAEYMFQKGKLTLDDVIGKQNFQIADGSIVVGLVINLKEVKIGEMTINDVKATVTDDIQAPLLLGQSVMERFGKITQDNDRGVIIFN